MLICISSQATYVEPQKEKDSQKADKKNPVSDDEPVSSL